MDITSTTNPRVKALVRLQQKAAERRTTGRFCVETPRILKRALGAGVAVEAVYFDPRTPPPIALMEQILAQGGQTFEVAPSVLQKIAYRGNPEGFVAVAKQPHRALADLKPEAKGWFVICSGLEKPGNLGAILRTADGAGASGVIIDQPAFDLYNPNCVRASTGAVFSCPVITAAQAEVMAWLDAHEIARVAATPEAEALYTEADLTGPLALVLGAEAEGLDDAWRQGAAGVRLPMMGLADSLNVSVTAGVLMYEILRQRARG